MYAELTRIMDYIGTETTSFDSLPQSVFGKNTRTNQDKTRRYLKRLYTFDTQYVPFAGFRHFWQLAKPDERPLLTLLYALTQDYLLIDSLDIILQTPAGNRLLPQTLEIALERKHPNFYTIITKEAVARRIISSYKQAGYLSGKVKNVRVPINPSHRTVAFALLLAYLNGDRGTYLLQSRWVRALELTGADLHERIADAAHHALLTYQRAGPVLSISFDSLLNQLTDGLPN